MPDLNETLDREVTISARRETVFRYFTDPQRWAKWWGAGSRIDGRPGGDISIRNPDGSQYSGQVLEIDPPQRIVFSYGPAGSVPGEFSRVTITLEEAAAGTILRLHHAFSSSKIRDHHVQGWRYQLAVFSRVASEDQHADAAVRVDAYLRAWGDPDAAARRQLLESNAAPAIVFRDAYSSTSGLEDLLAHLDAIQVFMPGIRLKRDGELRLSHGTAIAGWTADKEDGSRVGTGTNVYDLAPDGKIARVVGFWG